MIVCFNHRTKSFCQIVRENITRKEEVETLRLVALTELPIAKAHDESIHLQELYENLRGSQKALDMLLGSQRPSLRKEGLGYNPIKVKAKRVEKENMIKKLEIEY